METIYQVPKCKHGRDWDCNECAWEERRTWAREDAIRALEGVRNDLTQYRDEGILFLLDALIDELIEWSVEVI